MSRIIPSILTVLARCAVCGGLLALTAARLDACTVSTSGVSFGAYNVFSPTAVTSTGSITFTCPPPANKDVRITLDTGSSGTFAVRTLRRDSEQMQYNLYDNAGLTSIWGDGTAGTTFYFRKNVPGNNKPIVLTIYGHVPALQDVAAGSYSDTVVVTIDF